MQELFGQKVQKSESDAIQANARHLGAWGLRAGSVSAIGALFNLRRIDYFRTPSMFVGVGILLSNEQAVAHISTP